MNFVLRTIPRHLMEGVDVDALIEVDFMIDLNRQQLKPEYLILFNVTEQKSEPVTFEYYNKRLKIKPNQDMGPLMHYQLQLIGGNEGLRDITGRYLEETYVLEFYTKDVKGIKPPVVLSPTDLSQYSSVLTITWEQVMEADHYEVQISKSNTFHNLAWPSEENNIYALSFSPDMDFEKGQYYLRIRSISSDGIKSAYSPVITFYHSGYQREEDLIIQARTQISETSELSTLQQHFSAQNTEPVTAIRITAAKPAPNSFNLPPTAINEISVEFNEDINAGSLAQFGACYLIGERN
jgi:Bacterial Ig-like domain